MIIGKGAIDMSQRHFDYGTWVAIFNTCNRSKLIHYEFVVKLQTNVEHKIALISNMILVQLVKIN